MRIHFLNMIRPEKTRFFQSGLWVCADQWLKRLAAKSIFQAPQLPACGAYQKECAATIKQFVLLALRLSVAKSRVR
jgi:hypothetical protein